MLTSTAGCLALAQNFFTASRVRSPSLPSMRPLRQSSRLSSVCAFLICSGELAGNAAGAAAAGDWLGALSPPAALGTFCASSTPWPAATAPVDGVHRAMAIAADPARQTPPCIVDLSRYPSAATVGGAF